MSYVVTVAIALHPQHAAAFLPLMLENARASRAAEPGCHQFDVCVDPAQPAAVFLYERYHDRAAFDAHLASEHFRAFDDTTRSMIAVKTVRLLQRVDPA